MLVLSQELRQEVQHAILPLLLFLPLATSLSVLLGTLEGRERFDYLNIGQIVGLLLYQVFPLSAAFLGYITLPYLVGAAIFGRLLGSLLLFRFCIRILDGPFPTFHWKLLRSILPYGAWITVSAVVSPIMNLTDRFFIGAQLGMSFVARYVVPFNLVMYGGILPQSLATALFPRYASLEDDEARVTMFTAMRMLAATISPLCIVGIWWLHPFLAWWVGASFAKYASPVGQILLVGICINAIAHAPYGYLQAVGRADLTAKFHLVELILYLPALWWAISLWGIPGLR
ncbi:oligosaccharide flippase family protein [Acidithiobacillus sp. AMEEHan]|uniref:oligosaccharide flippase family protein n=1 Tax=Acidithiobacillus sp. AMEEHan TaxID=2994951 RepID=UPI0027E496C3|nr:oligosaccharide flippase family protein [Acidithiobacillus sp. AMEEHan]